MFFSFQSSLSTGEKSTVMQILLRYILLILSNKSLLCWPTIHHIPIRHASYHRNLAIIKSNKELQSLFKLIFLIQFLEKNHKEVKKKRNERKVETCVSIKMSRIVSEVTAKLSTGWLAWHNNQNNNNCIIIIKKD